MEHYHKDTATFMYGKIQERRIFHSPVMLLIEDHFDYTTTCMGSKLPLHALNYRNYNLLLALGNQLS